MKSSKFLAIALGLIALLLAIGWFLRNTIIERLSNPMLAQYNLRLTDVSLDALAPGDATISYLELEHANGAIITIDHLTLPIGTSSAGFKSYAAEKLTIEMPGKGDAGLPDLVHAINQLLGLPALLARTEVRIATISAAPYPDIRNVRWRLVDDRQELSMLVDSLLFSISIAGSGDAGHVLEMRYSADQGAAAEQSVRVEIQQTADGIALNGSSTLDLPLWTPITTMLGIDIVNVESGTGILRFDARLPQDTTRGATLSADFEPMSPVHIAYSSAPDTDISVTLESAGVFRMTASLPGLRWTVRQPEASLLVSYKQWRDVRVLLTDQYCQSGVSCSGDIAAVMENAALPLVRVERLEMAATQEATIGEDSLAVRILADATLSLTGLSGPDFELANFDARLTSAAALELGNDGWQVSAESVDIGIESFRSFDNMTISVPVYLDKLSVGEREQQLFAKLGIYTPSSEIGWGGRIIQLPGFSGGISRQGSEVAAIFETDGLHEEASIEANHDLDRETGQFSMRNAVLSFDSQELSSRISPWPGDWDIGAGTVAADLQVEWRRPDSAWLLSGQATMQAADLAGGYNENAFVGLSTRIEVVFDDTAGLTIGPSAIDIALVEVGLPVENISADYRLNPQGLAVEVENLRMNAFGGVITAEPFSFSTVSDSNTLHLHAESIELARMLSMQEFESVEISGSIGANLPVTISGESVTITGGSLYGEPPGGVIRYLPGLAADESNLSALGIATRALSNFEYETLTSELDYTADGDLRLQMRLTGRNPDLEDNRPVILNLGVENNIPQMLRSLQAARAVEDIIERRLSQ